MLNCGGLTERLIGEGNMGMLTYGAYIEKFESLERMNQALKEFEEIERAMTIHEGIEKWREENGLRQDQGSEIVKQDNDTT
jgi:hypothetical protein